jgi:hypothetical protein
LAVAAQRCGLVQVGPALGRGQDDATALGELLRGQVRPDRTKASSTVCCRGVTSTAMERPAM